MYKGLVSIGSLVWCPDCVLQSVSQSDDLLLVRACSLDELHRVHIIILLFLSGSSSGSGPGAVLLLPALALTAAAQTVRGQLRLNKGLPLA